METFEAYLALGSVDAGDQREAHWQLERHASCQCRKPWQRQRPALCQDRTSHRKQREHTLCQYRIA
eukprot:2541824-Rhodomonas_salina.2